MNTPTIDDVLELTASQLASLTKQQRCQLIDQLDQHTDHLQQTLRVLSQPEPHRRTDRTEQIDTTSMVQEYRQLRMKRVLIWMGFWPGVAPFVHRANDLVTA